MRGNGGQWLLDALHSSLFVLSVHATFASGLVNSHRVCTGDLAYRGDQLLSSPKSNNVNLFVKLIVIYRASCIIIRNGRESNREPVQVVEDERGRILAFRVKRENEPEVTQSEMTISRTLRKAMKAPLSLSHYLGLMWPCTFFAFQVRPLAFDT